MRTVVPFAADSPKTRLSDTLTPDERSAFARALLDDVLATVRAAGGEPTVLATAPVAVDAPVTVDDRSLSTAVNAVLADADCPVAVAMADLGIASAAALERLYGADGDVVIAPGRGGGTNALVVRHEGFRVDYHGVSYRDHREIAREAGASVAVVDSHRLATDVDERDDLAEVLLHGDGPARDWLVDAGFELDAGGGRVTVTR
ncbi:2-phospho-L-lactate guanylyltransferase [Halostella sp. JP-L12]|uniref:2-phospho-L-lactate guanylyltransferase n=1 Tax=Halostella TaxID=1843185 RepID=UPI000EF7F9DB|nr:MULTISPECIES: 2-phospho-L-lactate guanylyltransferase [Halostella]NHN46885.1 2-phospho-L-lactate guanylyltransferase [Halostella sp. JP-L12]